MDRDPSAVDCGKELNDNRISLYHSKFSGLPTVLKNLKVNKIHGILFDLGVSSPQLDNPDRGFSLQNKEI
jgi:16S rRNA (cytosine1402-N4)-methyltransferase